MKIPGPLDFNTYLLIPFENEFLPIKKPQGYRSFLTIIIHLSYSSVSKKQAKQQDKTIIEVLISSAGIFIG